METKFVHWKQWHVIGNKNRSFETIIWDWKHIFYKMNCKVYDHRKLCFPSHFTVSKLWFCFESQLSVSNVQLLFPTYVSKLHVTELFPFIRTKWYITCENTGKKSDKNVQVKASLNMGKWEWSSISEIISRMRRRNLIFRGHFSDFRAISVFRVISPLK